MKRQRSALIVGLALILSWVSRVVAHTEEAGPTFGLFEYFMVIIVVSLIVAIALIMLRRFETVPGSLPIRKLAIVATITIVINSLLLGFIYRDVLL